MLLIGLALILGGGVIVVAGTMYVFRWVHSHVCEWQLRCMTCGHWRDVTRAKLVRHEACSAGKQITGHCRKCGGRILRVEYKVLDDEEEPEESTNPS